LQDYNIIPYVQINQIASPWKRKVKKLTEEILKLPEADIQTIHEFEDGLYYRTVIIPAGVVLTGAEHKTPYRVVVKKGTITVNTDEGLLTITAPAEMDVAVGMERVGLTHTEEVIWTDIYVNEDNCKDLSVLEERLYVIPKCGLYDARKRLGYTKVEALEEKE